MANVLFKFGTRAQFDALATPRNVNTLYWLTDTQELYKGDMLFGIGAEATQEAAGLLPAADKKKLDELVAGGGTLNLVPVDKSVVMSEDDAGNKTIGVQLSAVEGNALTLADDGLMVDISDIAERLTAVEQAAAGGVHYIGSVPTFEDLPTDAKQGDLYEVEADNSEWCWSGEKWFEYGSTNGLGVLARAGLNETQFVVDEDNKLNLIAVDSGIVSYSGASMDEALPAIYLNRQYEVDYTPAGTLVNYTEDEIRVMCPVGTSWQLQNSGAGSDPNAYYIGLKVYAPADAVGFREDMADVIGDPIVYSFVDNPTAGTDKYGRKYSIVWLPVAKLDPETSEWTYYGAASTDAKYIGWTYSVEWHGASGLVIGTDSIRVNLSNEDCHNNPLPYFMGGIKGDIKALEESLAWGEI